jgi:hypothetical protein
VSAHAQCQPTFDALDKIYRTPTHIFTTLTMGSLGGAVQYTEVVYVGGSVYSKVGGSWERGDLQQVKQMEQKNRQDSTATCRYVRDETVNGETAAVYQVHSVRVNTHLSSDGWLWISKSRGLLLRDEQTIIDANFKEKTTARYEYTNVRPPLP